MSLFQLSSFIWAKGCQSDSKDTLLHCFILDKNKILLYLQYEDCTLGRQIYTQQGVKISILKWLWDFLFGMDILYLKRNCSTELLVTSQTQTERTQQQLG